MRWNNYFWQVITPTKVNKIADLLINNEIIYSLNQGKLAINNTIKWLTIIIINIWGGKSTSKILGLINFSCDLKILIAFAKNLEVSFIVHLFRSWSPACLVSVLDFQTCVSASCECGILPFATPNIYNLWPYTLISLCNCTITECWYNFKQTILNCINNTMKCTQACENFMSSFPY